MDECLILVDDSNIFIEGRKFSARRKETSTLLFNSEPKLDWSWRIEFGALLREVANGHKIIEAILFGSTPPPNDSLWTAAKSQGFTVKTYRRSYSNGSEKIVDTELVASGLEIVYEYPRPAILKLLSGDSDFIPLITRACKKGWETELWGFSSSISQDLANEVTRVKLLDNVFEKIGTYE
jgi:uncharacterized LabA/DUF88 family protein